MTTLAITGGQVLRPDLTVATADVLIDQERGEILEIGPDLAGDADETLDAADSLVTPGFVSGHCHVAMTLLRGTPMINRSRRGSRGHLARRGELTPDDVRVGAELGLLELIKSGTTAFADMYFHVPEVAAAVGTRGSGPPRPQYRHRRQGRRGRARGRANEPRDRSRVRWRGRRADLDGLYAPLADDRRERVP